MTQATYNGAAVEIICGGFRAHGLADGDFLVIEEDANRYSKDIGSDGEGSRSKLNNYGATITLRLKGTSDFNSILSAFAQADKYSDGGSFPFFAKYEGSIYTAGACWVEKMPSGTFAREESVREWVLATTNLIQEVAGV